MNRQLWLGMACVVALIVLSAGGSVAGAGPQATGPAAAAAKASPDLIGALSKEMSASPEQAAGAAGALLGLAKSRLKPEEFAQIANAVPGIDSLLSAAPAAGASNSNPLSQVAGTSGSTAMSQAAGASGALGGGAASGLASAASAFSKLGLSPDMVSKAVPVITQFVSKSGGPGVAGLLSGALK